MLAGSDSSSRIVSPRLAASNRRLRGGNLSIRGINGMYRVIGRPKNSLEPQLIENNSRGACNSAYLNRRYLRLHRHRHC